MNKLLIMMSLALALSCDKKTVVKAQFEDFIEIPYDISSVYIDSIAKNVQPNKHVDYWHYATYYNSYGSGEEKFSILAEGGDLKLRDSVEIITTESAWNGFFFGGHPSFRANYVVMITDGNYENVVSMEQLRDFIGSIDNLEEALLFARTFGYQLGSTPESKLYKFTDGVYTLRLVQFREAFGLMGNMRGELIEVSVTEEGYMKSTTIGIYCEGKDCI